MTIELWSRQTQNRNSFKFLLFTCKHFSKRIYNKFLPDYLKIGEKSTKGSRTEWASSTFLSSFKKDPYVSGLFIISWTLFLNINAKAKEGLKERNLSFKQSLSSNFCSLSNKILIHCKFYSLIIFFQVYFFNILVKTGIDFWYFLLNLNDKSLILV